MLSSHLKHLTKAFIFAVRICAFKQSVGRRKTRQKDAKAWIGGRHGYKSPIKKAPKFGAFTFIFNKIFLT